MLGRHICLSRISDFVIYIFFFFAYFKFHSDWGRVLGKIKQNELDCRDTAPLMATSFVLRLGTYWPWKSQSSYLVITEQAVSALYIKLLQNDRFRPPLVYSFAASRLPLSESGYIAFMVTSSRRRRMWWARKASARGMHVWKRRAACTRGSYTWQVIEINKKMGVRKGMNRTLSNARSVKKNKQTNKQTITFLHYALFERQQ